MHIEHLRDAVIQELDRQLADAYDLAVSGILDPETVQLIRRRLAQAILGEDDAAAPTS